MPRGRLDLPLRRITTPKHLAKVMSDQMTEERFKTSLISKVFFGFADEGSGRDPSQRGKQGLGGVCSSFAERKTRLTILLRLEIAR